VNQFPSGNSCMNLGGGGEQEVRRQHRVRGIRSPGPAVGGVQHVPLGTRQQDSVSIRPILLDTLAFLPAVLSWPLPRFYKLPNIL
jgi:hypothetical protein